MADVVIKKPDLNSETPEKNIAAIDTWIHDTADKLNYFMSHVGTENLTDDVINAAMIERILAQISQKQGLIKFDQSPKQNSQVAVTSGGVYTAIQNVQTKLEEKLNASPFTVKNGKVCIRYRRT